MEAAPVRRSFKMKKILIAAIAVFALNNAAVAASITNADADAVTVTVIEGSERVDLPIGPGETVEFCAGGCFVEFNGENTVLTGAESVTVTGNKLQF
jgi:hypothetical protein